MNVGTGGGSGDPDVMIDINTTPLIDVMLVLLVMLIITIPIQLHSVNLNMPTGNPPPPLVKPEVVKLDIDAHERSLLERRGRAGPRDARGRSSSAAAAQAVQPELHLRPDKAAKYDVVAGVMASAQRLGLTKIGIVGSEQFIEIARAPAARSAPGNRSQHDNGFRTATARPGPAPDRDRVRRPGARAGHLGAGDRARPQGGRGDQEAADRDDHRGDQAPPPPPPPPPKKIIEPPKVQAPQSRPTCRRRTSRSPTPTTRR